MLKPLGMRMRMSLAAVIVGMLASVTVMVLIAVAESPTRMLWLASDEIVGATMAMVLSSKALTLSLL